MTLTSSVRNAIRPRDYIVAVKATIDMQSPHAKLLCLNISNEVEILVVLKLAEDIKLRRK